MSWINEAPESQGLGRILSSHILNPEALEAHLRLYRTVGVELEPRRSVDHPK